MNHRNWFAFAVCAVIGWQSAAMASPLYGVASFGAFQQQNLYRISTHSGNATAIGNTGVEELVGLAWDGRTQQLYGYSADAELYTIDTNSGEATLVADALGIVPEGGLTFANGAAFTVNGDQLASLNLFDATQAAVGSMGADANDISGLAWDGGDTLFGYSKNAGAEDSLVSIAMATGNATQIGLTGINSAAGVGGLDVNPKTGGLYLSDGDNLYLVNGGDGSANWIGDHNVGGMSGIAFVPEPATLGFLLFAPMFLALRRNRRAGAMFVLAFAAMICQPALADRPFKSVITSDNKPVENGPTVDFYLTVLHNNDGESQLIDLGGTLTDFGGVARFKTLADNLKTDALDDGGDGIPRGVVMVSSGDNYLAGKEFTVSLNHGTPFYDTVGMDLIGYDAICIGNHEFDFGPDILADFIGGFSTNLAPWLSANLDFSGEQSLQDLVDADRIASSTVVTTGGRMVGIVGATTPDLRFISSPGNVDVDPDVAGIVQAEIDQLTTDGVDIIIFISHLQGIDEDLALLPLLSGIDIAVAGGGSELLASGGALLIPGDVPTGPYPTIVQDADNVDVPVVTTTGDYSYIGRLFVGFDSAGNIVEIGANSDPVRVSGVAPDAVAADPTVQAQVVDPVAAGVAEIDANVIGNSEVDIDGIRGNVRTVETNEGNLLADALFWTAITEAANFDAAIPDVAMTNGGGIRNDSIIPAGEITEGDTFDIAPFDNKVCTVEGISPAQFKEIVENCVSQVEFVNGRFAQIAGFRFTFDPSETAQVIDAETGLITTPGSRVRELILNDGTVIVSNGVVNENARDVNITTVNFLANGGDQWPFNGAPYTILGSTYQFSLRQYIENYLAGNVTAQDYAEDGEGRIATVE